MNKKSIILTLLSAVFILLMRPAVYSNEVVISMLQGEVEILKKGDSNWLKTENGQILVSGDKIRTGLKSKASLISQEGHKILIKSKTVFEITQLGPVDWEFKEETGRVRLKVEKLGTGQSLKVKTPTAVCSVRGTEFEVVYENRLTVCDVYEGHVGFSDAQQTSPEISILENQRSVVEQGNPPRPPEIIPEGERTRDPELSDRSMKGPGQMAGGAGMMMGSREGKQFPFGNESKEETKGRMEKEFQRHMTEFRGSPEEKERMEKEFKEHMERFGKEGMMGREGDSRGEYRGDRNFEGREGSFREGSFHGRDDEFRREIINEVNYDMQQDYHQENVKDELRIELVQTSRELIDRNGKRVRLEENVTRPTGDSFKFIALSKRDGREDSVVFEVVANKNLPTKLEDAGNLWFHFGASKPEWYVVKQRLTITNGRDTISQFFLDGDSKEAGFSGVFFNESGEVFSSSRRFETIFDHRYEFINGNSNALNKIWTDTSFRPSDNGSLGGVDVSGMMWHMRPILVEKYEPFLGQAVGSFWRYAFVTTSGSGNTATGKIVVTQYKPGSSSNLAHFVETNSYINFVDSNGNGRLDSGESYEDKNKNGQRDADELFDDIVQIGFNGTKDTSRTFSGTGDSSFFSDLNRDGLNNDGVSGTDAFSVAQRPWANLKEEMLMINDQGQIVDFASIGFGSLVDNKGDQGGLADLFEKLNMERVFTSSEFGGRDIDVIMTPRTFIKSKMIELKMDGSEPVDYRQ